MKPFQNNQPENKDKYGTGEANITTDVKQVAALEHGMTWKCAGALKSGDKASNASTKTTEAGKLGAKPGVQGLPHRTVRPCFKIKHEKQSHFSELAMVLFFTSCLSRDRKALLMTTKAKNVFF